MNSLLASDRAFAPCRAGRRGVRCGARCWPGAGGNWPAAAHHEQHARREGPAVKAGGARACAERTQNMPLMVVTLDVSKLSGWLNAFTDCRGVGRDAGGRGQAAAHHERHAQREGPAVKAEGG
eukprot:scaffold54754_cov65-Phaeocystis_antarctica.AAC.1